MIDYQLNNHIAYLTMDDGKANVFTPEMSQQLCQLLEKSKQEARATVLMGREGQFSGGYDLKVMQGGDARAMAGMVIAGFQALYQLASHPQPVVAACTGNAIGLGAFLLLVADTRIAIDGQSKICLPETRGGMPFTPLLVAAAQRLNSHKYKEAALQSKVYSPREAVGAGFIDLVVEASDFEQTVNGAAEQLSELPTKQYARNKLDLMRDTLEAMANNLTEIKANPESLAH